MTATDSFWHTFTSTRETQRRYTVGADNNFGGMRFELELIFEDILLAITAQGSILLDSKGWNLSFKSKFCCDEMLDCRRKQTSFLNDD
jgi:hypothetical protein